MSKKKKLVICPVEEKRIKLDKNKEVKIYFIKNFVAQFCFENIFVDDLFNNYSKEEQKAMIWHELYHKRFWTYPKRLLNFVIMKFNMQNAKWNEEFKADEYALENSSKGAVLGFLIKGREFYRRGVVKYNPQTHPTIKARIKSIERLAEAKKGEIKRRRKLKNNLF